MALLACEELGMPVAQEKLAGLAMNIVFLGIKVDLVGMQLRLPDEKRLALEELISSWARKRSVTK